MEKIFNNIISFIGDISLSGSLIFDSVNNYRRFEKISKKLNLLPVVIGNLETPVICENTINVRKKKEGGVILGTSEEVITQILTMLNIKYLTLANNHIGDYGFEGLEKTLRVLSKLKIEFTGAGIKEENLNPLIIKCGEKKISLLSYLHNSTNPKFFNEKILINTYERDKVLEDIVKSKQNNDLCILSLHWGKDWSYYPCKFQVKDAQEFIEAGVDLIIGHHTHTFQVFEEYNGKKIYYGIGDFCHGDYYNFSNELISMPLKSKISAILKFNIDNLNIEEIPTKILFNGEIIIRKKKSVLKNKYRIIIMHLIHRFKLFERIINIKEKIFDRVYDFLFGYRRRLGKQIFKLLNFNKIKVIFKESKAI